MRYVLILFLFAVLMPACVLAATPKTFQQLAAQVVSLLNSGVTVLIVAGIVVYFYGISTNIIKTGEGKMEVAKTYFFWGILAIFLMVSVWGILRLLQNTIFGANVSGSQNNRSQFESTQYINR